MLCDSGVHVFFRVQGLVCVCVCARASLQLWFRWPTPGGGGATSRDSSDMEPSASSMVPKAPCYSIDLGHLMR